MAASGVAAASVISQYLSAGLIVVHLVRRRDCCALRPSRKYISRKACADALMLGEYRRVYRTRFSPWSEPVRTDQALNRFDAITVSGNSAAANADAIIFNVQAAIRTACASFISRNRGAGNHSRMMKSYAASLTYSFAAGAILGGLLMLFGRGFLSLFANDAEVIDAGMERLYIMGWSYPIAAFMDCTIAAARGIGRTVSSRPSW